MLLATKRRLSRALARRTELWIQRLAAGFRPPAGVAFLLCLGLTLLGPQSSAHRLCATATLSAGHAMLVASFFQVSRHLLPRMLLPSLRCDEAWTRSTLKPRSHPFIRRSPPNFHGTRHSSRVQLPCRWCPAFFVLAPMSPGA